jgi:hypothetical protein
MTLISVRADAEMPTKWGFPAMVSVQLEDRNLNDDLEKS